MQNKAKLQKSQMNVSVDIEMNYNNKTDRTPGENEPNTNPIKANLTQFQSKTNPIKPNQSQNRAKRSRRAGNASGIFGDSGLRLFKKKKSQTPINIESGFGGG